MRLPSWLAGRHSPSPAESPSRTLPTITPKAFGHKPPSPIVTLYALHNIARVDRGVKPLLFHAALASMAQAHAEWMHAHGSCDYCEGKDGDLGPFERLAAHNVRFLTVAENAAFCDGSPQTVMSDWLKMKLFRDDILRPNFTHFGIGRSGPYWCVDFAEIV